MILYQRLYISSGIVRMSAPRIPRIIPSIWRGYGIFVDTIASMTVTRIAYILTSAPTGPNGVFGVFRADITKMRPSTFSRLAKAPLIQRFPSNSIAPVEKLTIPMT